MATVNEIPEALTAFEIYEDGTRLIGLANVTLPEMSQKTADISGAGIAGEVSVPIQGHFESMEVTLKWRTIFKTPLTLMKSGGTQLSCRGAMQHYEASSGQVKIVPVRCDVRARHTSTNLGEFSTGEQTETETKLVCDYVKLVVDDAEVVEYDALNYVYKVNGTDLMSDVRSALGLSS